MTNKLTQLTQNPFDITINRQILHLLPPSLRRRRRRLKIPPLVVHILLLLLYLSIIKIRKTNLSLLGEILVCSEVCWTENYGFFPLFVETRLNTDATETQHKPYLFVRSHLTILWTFICSHARLLPHPL